MCRCISFLPAVGQRSRAHRSDALPPQKGKPFNTLDHSSYSNKTENGGGNFSILKSIKRRNKKKEKKKMGNLVARFAHSGGGPVSFHKFIGGAPPRMKREREKKTGNETKSDSKPVSLSLGQFMREEGDRESSTVRCSYTSVTRDFSHSPSNAPSHLVRALPAGDVSLRHLHRPFFFFSCRKLTVVDRSS